MEFYPPGCDGAAVLALTDEAVASGEELPLRDPGAALNRRFVFSRFCRRTVIVIPNNF